MDATGILKNQHGTLNAIAKVGKDARIINGDFQDNNAIQCTVPNGEVLIMEFPKGELVGLYDFVFSDGVGGVSILYIDVYQDQEKIIWTTGDNENGEIKTITNKVLLGFDPKKEYKIVVRAGNVSPLSPLIIDYVRIYPKIDNKIEYNNVISVENGASSYSIDFGRNVEVIYAAGSCSASNCDVYPASRKDIPGPGGIVTNNFSFGIVARSGSIPEVYDLHLHMKIVVDLPWNYKFSGL